MANPQNDLRNTQTQFMLTELLKPLNQSQRNGMGGHAFRHDGVVIAVDHTCSGRVNVELPTRPDDHIVPGDIEPSKVHQRCRTADLVKSISVWVRVAGDLPGIVNPLTKRHFA